MIRTQRHEYKSRGRNKSRITKSNYRKSNTKEGRQYRTRKMEDAQNSRKESKTAPLSSHPGFPSPVSISSLRLPVPTDRIKKPASEKKQLVVQHVT